MKRRGCGVAWGASAAMLVCAGAWCQGTDPAPAKANAPVVVDTQAVAGEAPPGVVGPAAPSAAVAPPIAEVAARKDPERVPATEGLPLGAPTQPPRVGSAPTAKGTLNPAGAIRTALALGGVVAIILCLWAVTRRMAQRSGGLASQLGPGGGAPSGILTILGRYPIARGQTLVLLKLDRRVLLLSQTSSGFQTLSEVVEPEEVASILVKTQDDEGASLARRFKSILKEAEQDPSLGHPESVSGSPGPTTPRNARAMDDPYEGVFAGAGEPAPRARTAVSALRDRLATMRGGGA